MLRRISLIVLSLSGSGFLLAACGTDVKTQGSAGAGGTTVFDPDADPSGPKDPDIAAKAAVIVASCVPDDSVGRHLTSMYNERHKMQMPFDSSIFTQCLASAGGGCAAVEKCLGVTVDTDFSTCGATPSSCIGDTWNICDDGMHFTADCSNVGWTCSPDDGCVPKPIGPTCDPATFTNACQNDVPHVCSSKFGEMDGITCPDWGLKCGTDPYGTVACMGTGAECTYPVNSGAMSLDFSDGIACNGAKLRTCVNGGEHEIDCGTLATGFTCQTVDNAGDPASFCGLANECYGDSPVCEGDAMVVCNAGRRDKIDCKSLGFTGCAMLYGKRAYCTPSVYAEFEP